MFITINDHGYEIGKLNAKKQFHVARKLAPLLAHVPALMQLAATLENQGKDALKDDAALAAVAPLGETLAALPEADCDYIINSCLGVARRQAQGGTGYCAMLTTGGEMMFADMPMTEMLGIVLHVLKVSLGDFFKGQPNPPAEAAETPPPAAGQA